MNYRRSFKAAYRDLPLGYRSSPETMGVEVTPSPDGTRWRPSTASRPSTADGASPASSSSPSFSDANAAELLLLFKNRLL